MSRQEKYSKLYKIQSSEVDAFRRLRLSTMFTFMQEAAIHHTEQLGAGREKTLDRGLLWVVMLQHAEILRMPEYDEEIKLVSWPGKMMHVMFPRYYNIYDNSGKTVIRGSALWTLMDCETRKMVFPDEYGISIDETVTGEEYELPKPVKPGEILRTEEFTVPYSLTDINGHLTNTAYFDLAQDRLGFSEGGRQVKYAAAEYSGEARMGESFELGVGEYDEGAFVSGTKDGKKLFRLRLEY